MGDHNKVLKKSRYKKESSYHDNSYRKYSQNKRGEEIIRPNDTAFGMIFPGASRTPNEPVMKCHRRARRRNRRFRKVAKSSNPFILFYLKMLYRCSKMPITKVARLAGKRWCSMTECEKKKYIKLAKKERKRRGCKGR